MKMKDLLKGIYQKFLVSGGSTPAFNSYIGARMYLEEAPQGTSYPNCVYGLVNNSADWDFTHDFDEVLIDFVIFSDVTHVYMHRENSWLDKIPDAVSGKEIRGTGKKLMR